MDFSKIENVYLIGIGGIGMSALARYFNVQGKYVAGYDRTPSELTNELLSEGIHVHFDDKPSLIPEKVLSQKESTLVIYTPAIPQSHFEFNYFVEREYNVLKRAEVLGTIFAGKKGIAIAGTHGKTTTSTMVAHILKSSQLDCNAFLGGISKNYKTNLLLSPNSDYIVAEADEFDRSFLRLFPFLAIITSVDADHLDIYGSEDEVLKTFNLFARQISENGILIYKKGIQLPLEGITKIHTYTYSINGEADFYPTNIFIANSLYHFDLITPIGPIKDVVLGLPGQMNLENAIAASAAAFMLGANEHDIRDGLETFQGVERRFDFQFKSNRIIYIDDYAHHPEEIKACIASARKIFPDRNITGVFQPHLFTRTRDFADEFAQSLSLFDQIILLDIYPAREFPIEGVSSEMILGKIKCQNKKIVPKEKLVDWLSSAELDILITMGAGDIDRLVSPIVEMLNQKK